MKTLVSISFCAEHFKGGDGQNRQVGQAHYEWLEAAVLHYRSQNWPVIVAATGFPGILDVENAPGNCERDIAWRILARHVPILGSPHNPGHQVGAAQCIRIGLEAASKLGYDALIHTAEDVVPHALALHEMEEALDDDADYVGELWGPEGDRCQLNSQFFGCWVQSLVPTWDACATTGAGCLERYLYDSLLKCPKAFINPYYRTTHDRSEWDRMMQQEHGVVL